MSKTGDLQSDLVAAARLQASSSSATPAAQQPGFTTPAVQQPVFAGSNIGPRYGNIQPSVLTAVDRYEGRSDAYSWLSSFKELAALYGWNEDECLRIPKIRFKGAAQRWVQPRHFDSWDDFERQFLGRFGETRETAIVRLEQCYQRQGESPKSFADRFIEEAERAGRMQDDALLQHFIRRLLPDLRWEATRQRPQNLEDAIEFCNYWTGAHGDANDEPAGTYKPVNFSSNMRPARFSSEHLRAGDGPLFPREVRNGNNRNRYERRQQNERRPSYQPPPRRFEDPDARGYYPRPKATTTPTAATSPDNLRPTTTVLKAPASLALPMLMQEPDPTRPHHHSATLTTVTPWQISPRSWLTCRSTWHK